MKIEIGGVTFELRAVPGPIWFDVINKGYDKTKSDTEYEKQLMFYSIKSWDLKDDSGSVVELTIENFVNKLTALHFTRLLLECRNVNGISENEKKAFAALLSEALAGKKENGKETTEPMNTSGNSLGTEASH